ncbi:MAG: SDR family oxidoreductase [Actinobacteria bacterium]|nr:MAG: SDR family oxidoreductase [Actinomycetota bacterium]
MTGRTVLVTGGNAGIGKATAEGLARLGARVVITARDPARGERAVEDVRLRTGRGQVDWMPLNLASLASVRSFADDFGSRFDRLDVLDLNAGAVHSRRRLTEDGYETQFQVNHLGHFLLAQLLVDRLRAGAPSRIIVVSSDAHTGARRGLDFEDLQWERRGYRSMAVYSHTKLMNLYLTFELARRLEGTGVTVNAVHPGFVGTQFGRGGDTRLLGLGTLIARPFSRRPARGAQGVIWLAASPDVEGVTGEFFFDCSPARRSKPARDAEAARRLWDLSARLSGAA